LASIFDKILIQGVRAGQIPSRTDSARKWYRDTAANYGKINDQKMMNENKDRFTTKIEPGAMYMYYYDPKYKDTLPFYDKFPLIFPFKVERDRFWGLNLHYLPLQHRAILMDALYDLRSNSKYDESTKLKLSYEALNGASKFKFFGPCVKQYLISHVQSQFLYIYPSEWDTALFLPTARFEKQSQAEVWKKSKESLRG